MNSLRKSIAAPSDITRTARGPYLFLNVDYAACERLVAKWLSRGSADSTTTPAEDESADRHQCLLKAGKK